MEYNVEMIRTLIERWLAGETTLAEEAVMREFFNGARKRLPADLQPYRLLFGRSAETVGERSSRKLILHTEPVSMVRTTAKVTERKTFTLRQWVMAASTVAAAIVVAAFVLTAPERSSRSDILCLVNGVQITDYQMIEAYTREALKVADDNLRRPGEALSTELGGNSTLVRAMEMFEKATLDSTKQLK